MDLALRKNESYSEEEEYYNKQRIINWIYQQRQYKIWVS